MTNRVTIVEVGPRDGLQNEAARIATADKVAFVERLAAAGLPVVEVTSFVRPDRVPQLADAREVFAALAGAGSRARPAGTRYTALVPNLTGLREAVAAGVREVAIFAAASEGFSQRNTNRSIAQSLAAFAEVCAEARAAGVRVRGYLSTAFGCPFDGAVDPRRVGELARQLIDLGVYEVAISDTIGIAHPGQVPRGRRGRARAWRPRRPARAALPRHARPGAGQRDGRAAARRPHVRRLRRRPRRLPVRAGRDRQPRHRGSRCICSTASATRRASRCPALLEASAFIEQKLGHPLPSRVYRASRA